jgi:hypothetical protein
MPFFKFISRSILQAIVGMTPVAGGAGYVIDFVDLRGELPRTAEWPMRPGAILGQTWHHTASPRQSIQTINQFHRSANGWNSISYHYAIDMDGTIFWCNDPERMTWHAGHAHTNRTHIGIAVIGNFERHDLTQEQRSAIARLIPYLEDTYGASLVTLHHMHRATLCPGKNMKEYMSKYVR